MKSSLWLQFRYDLDEIEKRCGYSALGRMSQRTLEWVAREEKVRPMIYVQTVIMESGVASPATLHKALKTLQHDGFLSIETDKKDTRRRIIKTTPKARKILDRLSSELVKMASRAR
jgi:DNA-binding MarR family transcriptional regulator